MDHDDEMKGKTIGKSIRESPKNPKWESVGEISEEDIARILRERPGGRKAGRGDSPYTQEFYEETYGIKEGKK